MELSQNELEDLAGFFGRRLDPALARTPPPADTREEKRRTAAWLLVLEEAADQGRLSALFTRIRNRHPGDPQLQHALALLLEPGARGSSLIGGVILATAAAGFLFVASAVGGGGLAVWYGLQPDPAPARVSAIAPTRPLGPIAVGAPATPRALASVETGPSVVPVRAEASAPTGRCTTPDGGRVGYWYAGRTSPGLRGDRVRLDGAVNVRLDYPDAHNGYHAGAHIECVLQPGDVVQLSADPIAVPGGAWWVPLTSGDLVHKDS